jgi:hypothetical protein
MSICDEISVSTQKICSEIQITIALFSTKTQFCQIFHQIKEEYTGSPKADRIDTDHSS